MFEPAALPELLVASASPKAVWDGFASWLRCQALVPWWLQEGPSHGRDGGIKGKGSLALWNEPSHLAFKGLGLQEQNGEEKCSKVVVMLLSSTSFEVTHK